MNEYSLAKVQANYFIVENFYGLNEGQSYAYMNMYGGNANTGIYKIGEFNFCWAWYRLSITDSNGNKDTQSFDFVKAYDNMSIGDYVRLKANNGITYTFTYLGKIKSDKNAEKAVGFVCDHPLYFGGKNNGSVGIENFSNRVQIGYVEYYNYVDLGLPSGTLWCDKNISAYNIYAEGVGFAWGETEDKNSYSWSNYKYYDGSNLTKYCSLSDQGIVDNKYVLDLEDDAATVNCGSEWCIPTVEQWKELKQYCQGQYISNSNGRGWKFTGPNGNSIFIPCFKNQNSGAYWSSTLSEKNNKVAYNVDFDYGGFYIDDSPATTRMMSQLIRPVLRKNNITINQTNFPDANFRAFIRDQPYGNDGVLTVAEISEIKELQLGEKQISDLKGIEFFSELIKLYCYSNNLTNLDVSKNTALKVLSCGNNKLTKLDVSKNTQLTWLNCSNNSLGKLDISKNTKLTFLCCHNCNLTTIDVTKNTLLETFEPSRNRLSTLNISKNTILKELYCHINQLSTLDISNNSQLVVLSCYSNKLSKLDGSKNPMIENMNCNLNQLTELNLLKNTNLKFLNCESNKLTTLDVSKNTALETLYCDINHLTHLNVSNNKALIDLACYANQIKGTAMDELVNSLPDQPYAEFNVFFPDEEEGNICTKEQAYRAKQKGWLVLYWNNGKWEEYEGCDPSGIQNITLDKDINAPVYDLNGRKLKEPSKGINIIGRKKVVVK